MLKTFIAKFKKATAEDLYKISLRSSTAKSGEVYIFEKGKMSDLFGKIKAEKIRKSFLKNNTKVKQITNIPTLPKFTDNNEFVNTVMTFRYVPKNIFSIKKEVLIFDGMVAIYDKKQLLVIEDAQFADSQKQLFMSIWEQGQSPVLAFMYKPNHSYYNNLNYYIDDLQIIVWPDADAKIAYKGLSEKTLGTYIKNIIRSDKDYLKASYYIVFIWSFEGDKGIDVWKHHNNFIDDRSGPLTDVKVYREGKLCTDLSVASGNSFLVLGYEEKLRRQSKDLKSYLEGPVPKLPLEIMNGKNFFDE